MTHAPEELDDDLAQVYEIGDWPTQTRVLMLQQIRDQQRILAAMQTAPNPAVSGTILFDGIPTMAYQLQSGKKTKITVTWEDAAGNPAKVDGVVDYDVTQGDSTLETSGEDTYLRAGAPGAGQVSATADVDLGDGLKPLTLLGDFEVLSGEAVGGSIEFGPPED